jgi:hypothetical protein
LGHSGQNVDDTRGQFAPKHTEPNKTGQPNVIEQLPASNCFIEISMTPAPPIETYGRANNEKVIVEEYTVPEYPDIHF